MGEVIQFPNKTFPGPKKLGDYIPLEVDILDKSPEDFHKELRLTMFANIILRSELGMRAKTIGKMYKMNDALAVADELRAQQTIEEVIG
jgi:hypothetical protein